MYIIQLSLYNRKCKANQNNFKGDKVMTTEKYYEILKREWEKVNKDDLKEIKRYNELKRQLRQLIND